MGKKSFCLIMAVLCLPLSAFSSSSSHSGAIVKKIKVWRNGIIAVELTTTHSEDLACTSDDSKFAFNSSTGNYKEILSVLLTAKTTGHKVNIEGTGACDEWNTVEGIATVELTD